jgi:photosystem II stability/assembly factor-like uncharacterized protein
MKKMLILTWLGVLVVFALGQDWQTVREGSMEYVPSALDFIDTMTGLYVGDDGVVVKTTDGGQTGETLRMPDGSGVDWDDVEFADANIGYACATDGYIFKTEDGGTTWTMVADTANYISDLNDISVINANLVYVAGDDSLLLKTIDGGATWTKSDFNFDGEDLDGGMAFLNADSGVVAIDNSKNPMTWYTHDGGATWNPVLIPFPMGTISYRFYDVSAGGASTFAVAGYHHTVYISNDAGETYTHANDVNYAYEYFNSIKVVDDNTIYAAGSGGLVIKTVDGGANWDTLYTGSGQTPAGMDFVSANDGYIFQGNGQWFKTTDGGENWTPILDWPNISFWGLALPSDDKIVITAFGGGELSMSEDGGQTWSYPTNLATMTSGNIYECEFANENLGLIGGGYGFLSRTTDGGETWTFIDNPMYQNTNKHINAVRIIDENTMFAGGSSGIIIKSTDGGLTWTETTPGGTQTVYDMWPVSATQLIASAGSGQIYLSNEAIDAFTLANDYGSMSMRAVEFRGDVGLVAASSGNLYRTTVADWDTLTLIFEEPAGEDFYDVEFVNDTLVYAVGEHGIIYRSGDAGLTWTAEMSPTDQTLQKVAYRNNKLWAVGQNGTVLLLDMTPPTPVEGLVINEFMASNDGSVLDEFGGADDWFEIYNTNEFSIDVGGLYVTDDLAEPTKWQIPDTAPDTTTIPAGGFLVIWADKETDQGVLHTDIKLSGDGEQIGLVEDFLGEIRFIDSLTFGPQNADTSYGRLTDGGDEWGFFNPASPGESNSNGTLVSIEHRPDVMVREYKLAQNYPNPFNPVTTIEYSIKKAGKVKLTVYSLTGQKVATLINEKMDAGSGKVVWNASSLASGIYFYELKSGDFVSVKKLVLMK